MAKHFAQAADEAEQKKKREIPAAGHIAGDLQGVAVVGDAELLHRLPVLRKPKDSATPLVDVGRAGTICFFAVKWLDVPLNHEKRKRCMFPNNKHAKTQNAGQRVG